MNITTLFFTVFIYPAQPNILLVQVKCPSELVEIKTPTTSLIHKVIDTGFECINNTKLIPYELKQVCS